MCFIRFIALLLVVAGAINWGLWGLFQYDYIADGLNGNTTGWARLIYSLIGFAGVFAISFFFHKCFYLGYSKKTSCEKEEHKD